MIKKLLYISCIALIFSCNQGSEKERLSKEIFLACNTDLSKKMYLETRKILYDSINYWADNNLKSFVDWKKFSCKIDTLICFNNRQDRIVTAKLIRDTYYPDASMDYLQVVYGAKFDNKWYFFNGESVVLSREAYQTRTNIPLSFEKLHEIAVQEIFIKYFTKTNTGIWVINDARFKGMEDKNTSKGFGSCFTCNSFEEYVMHRSKENWRKKAKEGF